MASSVVPNPGSKYGPCVDPCGHRDCAELQHIAGSPCRYCCAVIGYDRHYYRDTEHPDKLTNVYVHAACLEDAIERERTS